MFCWNDGEMLMFSKDLGKLRRLSGMNTVFQSSQVVLFENGCLEFEIY